MKRKLILGSFLAFATGINAQVWTTVAGQETTPGKVGIGTNAPADQLHVKTGISGVATNGGIILEQIGTGSAWLTLKNTANASGGDYTMYSSGSAAGIGGGHFALYDWKTNQHRLFVQGSTGNVGIGTTNPGAKLQVDGNGVWIGVSATGTTVGVKGNCTGTGYTGSRTGVRGEAVGGAYNYGGVFVTSGSTSGVSSFGVYTDVGTGNLGGNNYGVYSTVGGNSSSGTGPVYAGYFDGDVVTTSSSFYPSDRNLKTNITTINNSLNIISKLNPVTYNFDRKANPDISLPFEKQYGFISQEVEKILPEFAKTIVHPAKIDDDGNEIYPKKEILGLNYNGFIALLTKGIQEQQQQLDAQQKSIELQNLKIETLEQKLSKGTGIDQLNIEAGFTMSQNQPNPFTHETVVKYTLPQTVTNAYMAVYDLTGKQITTFPIEQKGASFLTITSEKLSPGIYIYSIVADGKIMDSKRMVVAEK